MWPNDRMDTERYREVCDTLTGKRFKKGRRLKAGELKLHLTANYMAQPPAATNGFSTTKHAKLRERSELKRQPFRGIPRLS